MDTNKLSLSDRFVSYSVKRAILLGMMCLLCMTAQSQIDFKLYFANNVGEVSRVSRLKEADSELSWREAPDGTIAGNRTELEPVKKMFAETRQKTRADQEIFWKMRDDNLLCFRINDGKGTSGEFEARARSGAGRGALMKNVSGYFFVNTDSKEDSIFITVNRKGCKPNRADTLHFKYYVYDWNNSDLLVFKLDSRRRKSGLTYQLEYVTEDETGKILQRHSLDLSGNNFQSFYRPADRNIKDIFLVSNGNRLKLDKKRLLYGANLSDKLNRLWLNTNFTLDKHKNRELTIFNMLGSGLFEQYDTLYLQVMEAGGQPVKCVIDEKTKLAQGFSFNIAEVDAKGKYVSNGVQMKYVGCNPKTGTHKILTYGNPCYIEVFAPGCYPAVFKFAGAYDPETRELNQNRVSGKLLLIKGAPTASGPDISDHQIHMLKDDKRTLMYDGKLHQVFSVQSSSMSVKPSSSYYLFIEDGGYQSKPKLLNNKPITKYAEMSIAYSIPKSNNTSSNTAQLRFEEVGSSGSPIQVTPSSSSTIDGNDYPTFQRTYYEQRWNLVGVLPKVNNDYKPRLTIGSTVYNELPLLRRGEINEEQIKKQAQQKAEDYAFNRQGWDYEYNGLKSFSFMGDLGKWDFRPISLPGLKFSVVPYLDPLHGLFELDVYVSNLWDRSDGKGDSWRDNVKENGGTGRYKVQEMKCSAGAPEGMGTNLLQGHSTSKMDKDHWIQAQMDDIFKVETNKLGHGPFIDGHIGFGVKLFQYDAFGRPDNDETGFYFKGIDIFGGYGIFASHFFDPIKFAFFSIRLSAQASAQVRAGFGVKNYNFKRNGAIYDRSLGFFVDGLIQGKAGFTLKFGLDFEESKPKDQNNQNPDVEQPGNGNNQRPDIIQDNNSNDNDVSHNTDDSLEGVGEVPALAPRRADGVNQTSAGTWVNRLFAMHVGIRGGAKMQFNAGWTYIGAHKRSDGGLSFMVFGAFEGFADIKIGPFIRYNPRWTGRVSYFVAYPDANSNPTIPGYPNYFPVKKAPALTAMRAPAMPVFPVGSCILDGLNYQARPFFTDDEFFIMENGGNGSDLNHDKVAEYILPAEGDKLDKDAGLVVTSDDRLVQNHSFDKELDCEMMVYEQMTRPLDVADIEGNDYIDKELDQTRYMQIASSHRSMKTGQWEHHVVAYDENLYDCNPVVAVNTWTENNYSAVGGVDDEAACVWKRGLFTEPPFNEATATEQEKEQHRSLVESGIRAFEGDLVLSLFDGEKWSAPESIIKLDKSDFLSDYQIVMRNDTVLAALMVLTKESNKPELRYYCKPAGEPVRYITTDKLYPVNFSLDLVGAMPTIAILNQVDSANCDIYVKEIDMKGRYKCYGTDLCIARYNPASVKILVDKNNDSPEDFAVLWKCHDRAISRNGDIITTDSTQTMLNCSRIFMRENMTSIPHVTLACTTDSTYMSGYSAFMDELKVKVLYTLTDLRDGNTYLMKDQVEFGYSFKYDIGYSPDAMISADMLPINLTVYNTGATPITYLEGYINDQQFTCDDVFINPYSTQTIPLEYELSEDFDGMLTAHDVLALFEDKWGVQQASRRGAPARRAQLSSQTVTDYASGNSDLRCELLGHTIEGTVNKVYLELTDFDILNDNETVHVGLYTDHVADVPITSTAEALLKASDFSLVGNDRKAYVELTVDGLQSMQDVEIRARVYNDKVLEDIGDDEDVSEAIVDNLSWQDNQHIITLLPVQLDDVTLLPVVQRDDVQQKVKVEQTEQGVWISGLEENDYVRVFDAAGRPVFLHSHPASRLFMPLEVHGVYLLSTGQEFVKFTF